MGDAPVVFDWYCGEGGVSRGWVDAGATVVGGDLAPSRLARYPFPHWQGDAIEGMTTLLDGGTLTLSTGRRITAGDIAVHVGSPPCTGYSRGTAAIPDRLTRYDRLIAVTREAFEATGRPYVIENVEDAAPELRHPLTLCGSEFGLTAVDTDGTVLTMKRHRLFESNVPLLGAGGCLGHGPRERRQTAGAYGGARRDKVEAREVRKGGYVPKDVDVLRSLLGTPWMSEEGCFLSIPPVYARHIAEQVLDVLPEWVA